MKIIEGPNLSPGVLKKRLMIYPIAVQGDLVTGAAYEHCDISDSSPGLGARRPLAARRPPPAAITRRTCDRCPAFCGKRNISFP
ncbi:unnamed protein product [Parnassius apollo]|uniref:(apollo) hypothetical protein n=1 Tax=Parnassius apollo TaxID=110799 RepID=A0A8S3XKV5_PARAO|nr:unnamed protein product [Parnassius apollo]